MKEKWIKNYYPCSIYVMAFNIPNFPYSYVSPPCINATYGGRIPGQGKEVGPSLGMNKSILQGLFFFYDFF